MKTKNPTKTSSKKDPFVAGFILPVLLMASFAPVLLFQAGDVPGDVYVPPTETAEQKYDRMISAFDRTNILPGVLIVSFTPGTTVEQANSILQPFGLKIDQKQICNAGQAVEPNGTVSAGQETCFSDGWYDMLASGRVLVTAGQEKILAGQLYQTSGIVWVEPDYEVTLDGSNPQLGVEDNNPTIPPEGSADNQTFYPPAQMQPTKTNTILGIEPIVLVIGVLLVGFGAYFVMGKK
jgi:hypothetical protein